MDDYRNACRQLLKRAVKDTNNEPREYLRILLITCLLHPLDDDEAETSLKLVLHHPGLDPIPKGIAAYRSDQAEEALPLLHSNIGGAMYATAILFRALCFQKQGRVADASKTLATGRSIIDSQGLRPGAAIPIGRVGYRTSVEWVIAYLVLQEAEQEISDAD